MSLSVVIITFNEEQNIERCIKSVLPVADEVIIVDSFSSDRTAEIAQQYDVVFIQQEFLGYGLQKQFATNQATYDYVLSLDADEELSTQLQQSVLNEKTNWRAPYYSFNRRNFYCGQPINHSGWYPDTQVRLFNRKEINWNSNAVHESIDDLSKDQLIHLAGDLNHYTCTDVTQHERKEEKYARINSEVLKKKGKKIPFFLPYIKGGFRFFKTYILKLGFLDGAYGFKISKTLAKSSYLKYTWAREGMKKQKER